MPELWPSPWPGAPSISGSCYATPGFCEACGMSSISEPSEITGLPEPHVATHAVGMPATPRSILKPSFSRMPVRYFEVSNSWKPEFAETEHGVHHHLRLLLHGVDLAGQIGLHGGGLFGRNLILREGECREGKQKDKLTHTDMLHLDRAAAPGALPSAPIEDVLQPRVDFPPNLLYPSEVPAVSMICRGFDDGHHGRAGCRCKLPGRGRLRASH